jgi:hypothetical protein
VLRNATPKMRKTILASAPDDLIKTINEIVYNILIGNHYISKKSKTGLKKYKNKLRQMVKHSRSLTTQRKVLVQSGGAFLPILLSAILSGIIGKILE